MKATLLFADALLYVLHLGVVIFCVTGWMIPETRLANLVLVVLIALSWFGLGQFLGLGYCLITDLQWRVKQMLGRRPASDSFIKYQLDKLTGMDLDAGKIDRYTQAVFYISAIASLYANFI